MERQGHLFHPFFGGPPVPGSELNVGFLVLYSHSRECIDEGQGGMGEMATFLLVMKLSGAEGFAAIVGLGET